MKKSTLDYQQKFTLSLFDKLVRWQNLTPLTNNPDEWCDISKESGEPLWQSKRCSSCFSYDNLKTYYDNEEECNKIFELDEQGNKTGWISLKPRNERKLHELKSRKER